MGGTTLGSRARRRQLPRMPATGRRAKSSHHNMSTHALKMIDVRMPIISAPNDAEMPMLTATKM